MTTRVRRRALVLAALAVAAPSRARADDTHRQIAQQLFDDGRALLDAGKIREACPKFAESQRLDPGGGTLLNLALCHEKEGKTASAWGEYHDALAQAVKDERKDREDFAREHIDALRPKLVRIVVSVPPTIAALKPEVTLDGARLPEPAWGSAVPVDPGDHHVEARAAGRRSWTATITATELGRAYIVEVAESELLEACPNGQVRMEGRCVSVTPPAERRSTAFWIVLGGAGALAVTSAVTGVVAWNADRYVKDNCSTDRDFCRVDDAGDAASRARTFAWISTATLAAAGAATLVAFFLPRSYPTTTARIEVGIGTVRVDAF